MVQENEWSYALARVDRVGGVLKKSQRPGKPPGVNGMTLAEMPNSGDMGPEETTSRSQTGSPMEEWGNQPTYTIFDLKSVLSKEM